MAGVRATLVTRRWLLAGLMALGCLPPLTKEGCDPALCAGRCVEGRCTECQPQTIACLTRTDYLECSPDGAWSETQSCEGQACAAAGCQGVCEPGQRRCSGTTAIQTCTNEGQWGEAQSCENDCVGTSCLGECIAGESGCRDENTRRRCNADGQWETSDCPVICDVDSGECVECLADWRRCDPADSSRMEVCIAGAWQSLQACDRGCSENRATRWADCNECSPGQIRCKTYPLGTRQECNAAGEWEEVDTCPDACSGNGVCSRECTPGSCR